MPPPLIGLNSDFCDVLFLRPVEGVATLSTYVRAVAQAGAMPMIIPPTADRSALEVALDRLEGLVLVGGLDLPPQWYGQKPHQRTQPADPRRLEGDRLLVEMALTRGLPILAICMGCQLINVVLGGDLIQDIPSQIDSAILHSPSQPYSQQAHDPAQAAPARESQAVEVFHPVSVQPGSRLASVLGREHLEVNSSHHQALGQLGEGLRAVARAPDGILEAVEGAGDRFLLGVQWHPERLAGRPEQRALFRALVEAAVTFSS